jgi:hypothetical protein
MRSGRILQRSSASGNDGCFASRVSHFELKKGFCLALALIGRCDNESVSKLIRNRINEKVVQDETRFKHGWAIGVLVRRRVARFDGASRSSHHCCSPSNLSRSSHACGWWSATTAAAAESSAGRRRTASALALQLRGGSGWWSHLRIGRTGSLNLNRFVGASSGPNEAAP